MSATSTRPVRLKGKSRRRKTTAEHERREKKARRAPRRGSTRWRQSESRCSLTGARMRVRSSFENGRSSAFWFSSRNDARQEAMRLTPRRKYLFYMRVWLREKEKNIENPIAFTAKKKKKKRRKETNCQNNVDAGSEIIWSDGRLVLTEECAASLEETHNNNDDDGEREKHAEANFSA